MAREQQGETPSPEVKKTVPKVVIVSSGDDWEGLYIDGILAAQCHQIKVKDVLGALGIEFDKVWCNNEWLEDVGCLPSDLKEVRMID